GLPAPTPCETGRGVRPPASRAPAPLAPSVFSAALLALCACSHAALRGESPPLRIEEASLAQLQAAMASGALTSRALTQHYLDRIARYDKAGPKLHELARAGTTVSSLGGQTLNPYDLSRTPGGSSGGTAVAVAANLAAVGLGSDTVNSVRSPASACDLVGLRPTRGLVSRSGIIPAALTQDMAGPLTRTVADAAAVLEVIQGFDPRDETTEAVRGKELPRYAASLDRSGLRGARIGVLRSFFGQKAEHAEVNRVVDAAVARMKELGAEPVELSVPIDVD